jgi:Flp pilus assembly pilin Flp
MHSVGRFSKFIRQQHAQTPGGPDTREEVNKHMFISWWLDFARQNWRKEDGQTMAEYGVVLAVITIGAIVAFTALSGGISKAINNVTSLLP